jgi:hypothetical protein
MLDPDATLTHEEILSRFKKLFNREMTLAEKKAFFLPESFPKLGPRESRRGKTDP